MYDCQDVWVSDPSSNSAAQNAGMYLDLDVSLARLRVMDQELVHAGLYANEYIAYCITLGLVKCILPR